MARLGVGVVGLGMGRNLLRANGVEGFPAAVRAVCDLSPARREAAAREHGVGFTTDRLDARRPPFGRRASDRQEPATGRSQ